MFIGRMLDARTVRVEGPGPDAWADVDRGGHWTTGEGWATADERWRAIAYGGAFLAMHAADIGRPEPEPPFPPCDVCGRCAMSAGPGWGCCDDARCRDERERRWADAERSRSGANLRTRMARTWDRVRSGGYAHDAARRLLGRPATWRAWALWLRATDRACRYCADAEAGGLVGGLPCCDDCFDRMASDAEADRAAVPGGWSTRRAWGDDDIPF